MKLDWEPMIIDSVASNPSRIGLLSIEMSASKGRSCGDDEVIQEAMASLCFGTIQLSGTSTSLSNPSLHVHVSRPQDAQRARYRLQEPTT
jgi:hypothetical protein